MASCEDEFSKYCNDFSTEEHLIYFFTRFSNIIAENNFNYIYKTSAILKYLWLAKKGLDFIKDEDISKTISQFKYSHPFEQILGYISLLGKETKDITEKFDTENYHWEENLIKPITIIFNLQINEQRNESISTKNLITFRDTYEIYKTYIDTYILPYLSDKKDGNSNYNPLFTHLITTVNKSII